jgi:hypothetical protein
MLNNLIPSVRVTAGNIAHHAFAMGFATITAIAALMAGMTAALVYAIIKEEDIAPVPDIDPLPCKAVDCRSPL